MVSCPFEMHTPLRVEPGRNTRNCRRKKPSKDAACSCILKWRDDVTVSAHFDGKVIVLDEPLDLRPNQALRIQIEPIEDEAEESALAWIAPNAVESDALPTDLAEQHDHYLYGRPKKDRRG